MQPLPGQPYQHTFIHANSLPTSQRISRQSSLGQTLPSTLPQPNLAQSQNISNQSSSGQSSTQIPQQSNPLNTSQAIPNQSGLRQNPPANSRKRMKSQI